MTSGIAAAAAPNGAVYVCGRGTDNQIWYGKSANGATRWSGAWAVPMGLFETGPAIGIDATGAVVHVAAVGTDHKMLLGRSLSGGTSWMDAKTIGSGLFTSNPAIAVSADGQIIHVFGRGTDYRIWYNKSTNSGDDFQPHWTPIGEGIFTTGPAAGCSSNGARVHVAARGFWQDGIGYSLWTNTSANVGNNFNKHWQRTNLGQFLYAPDLCVRQRGDRSLCRGAVWRFQPVHHALEQNRHDRTSLGTSGGSWTKSGVFHVMRLLRKFQQA